MSWTKKDILIGLGIIVLFFVLRVGGIDNLYHQDEYKWPLIVLAPESGGIPHPPLGEFIYKNLGGLVGADNFRIIPLIFSSINIFLLYYLAKIVGDKKSALWSVFFYVISAYSVIASLMVDTDGAIMPTFFLIMCIGYYKLRQNNPKYLRWLILLLLGAVAGFFVKASFVVAIGALALDFAFEKKVFADRKKLFKYLLYTLGGAVLLGALLLLAKLLFPFFRLEASVKYWEHFFKFADRGWLQTLIQFVKSIMYLSPLLVLPLLFLEKETISKYRPFLLFIAVGLFFYLVAFDFSTGALDRYFQFLILPLVILVGAVFAKFLGKNNGPLDKTDVITISTISLAIFAIQFFYHYVPPLYPKTEWLSRVVSLKWNFVFPFTGGSGPTGFYVSFLFIALIWICCVVFVLSALKISDAKRKGLFCLLVLGILYNGVFVEEYIWGKINGSAYSLFDNAKTYIAEHKEIKKVVVYNDIGAYDIQKMGRYERRLYATPQFEPTYKEFFRTYSGAILYIDIPPIAKDSFYAKYFGFCETMYSGQDRKIHAKIYYCKPPQ